MNEENYVTVGRSNTVKAQILDHGRWEPIECHNFDRTGTKFKKGWH
jgi:hypothetical protein